MAALEDLWEEEGLELVVRVHPSLNKRQQFVKNKESEWEFSPCPSSAGVEEKGEMGERSNAPPPPPLLFSVGIPPANNPASAGLGGASSSSSLLSPARAAEGGGGGRPASREGAAGASRTVPAMEDVERSFVTAFLSWTPDWMPARKAIVGYLSV